MTDFGKLYADEAHKKKVLLEVLSERDAEIERLRRELAEAREAARTWENEAERRSRRYEKCAVELAKARGLLRCVAGVGYDENGTLFSDIDTFLAADQPEAVK